MNSPTTVPTATSTLGATSTPGTHTYVISATVPAFTDTGLEIPAGSSVNLTVAGNATCHAGGTSDCPIGNPSGVFLCRNNPYFPGDGPGPAGPAIPYDSLAAKIGATGPPFVVGPTKRVTSPTGGELYLVFNDCTGGTGSPGYADNAGQDTVTVTVTSSISVTIGASVPAAGVPLGQTISVPVTVSAGANSLSSVSLANLKFVASGPTPPSGAKAILTVTSTPPGTTGFSLAANGSKTFTYQLKATATGVASVGVTATGKDANGTKVTASAQQAIAVTTKALVITLVSSPGTTKLAVNEKGVIETKKVNVVVTFANVTKKTITGVQLIGLDPEPQDKTQALTQLALPKKSIPLMIGSVSPGAKVKKTFTLSVNGDGAYEWRALALYNDPTVKGGNGRAIAVGGPFETKVPPLYFTSATTPDNIYKQNGAEFVRGGNTWYVKATIKNESSYKTLCVSPVVPTFKGNAAGIGPHDITVAGVREDAPPYAGPLKPGDSATIEMYVDTSSNGSTRGEVTFDPRAAVLDKGASCTASTVGAMTPLAAADTTIPKGTDSELVRVDTSNPIPITRSGAEDLIYGVGAIPVGVVQALFDSAVALEAGAGDAVSLNGLYTSLLTTYPPVAAVKTSITAATVSIAAYQALVTATDVVGNYWKSATPTEKQSFVTQVESVMRREGNDFYKAAVGTAGDVATAWLDKVESAYASGDDARVFSLYGNTTGDVATQIAIQVALTEAGQTIIAKAPALTAAFEKVAGSSVTIAALRDMPPGKLLNFGEMQRLWGLSQEDLAAFSRIAKENDVLIGVRGRAPISVTNLEEGAVWKHENLKPKNVNPIDIQFLGFPANDAGTVQFRSFSIAEEQAITDRIHAAGLTPDELKVVLDRFDTRVAESKYLKTIQGYSKAGEINVGFNYADNGISRASTRQIRKFKLVETKLPDGGTIYTPYQENLNLYSLRKTGKLPSMCERALGSVLCKVTGDMDGVYITTTSGTAVAQDKLVKIYEELQKAGWQHPETLTWINSAGDFYFAAKEKILRGLQVGGEATIQFAPNGNQYATYIDLAKSKLINSTNYYLDLVGGYTTLAKAS